MKKIESHVEIYVEYQTGTKMSEEIKKKNKVNDWSQTKKKSKIPLVCSEKSKK